MAEVFEENENEVSPEEAFAAGVNVASRRRKPKEDEHIPIQASEHIPLFPDYDKDSNHVIVRIDVFKLNPPGDGYKGHVTPSSDLVTIGRLFGNGLYNLQAVAQNNKVLRRAQNVKIELPAETQQAPQAVHRPVVSPDMTLLNFQRDQHKEDVARITDMAKEASAQSREQSTNAIKMVQETAAAQIARDREFFGAMMGQTQQFFGGIMAIMEKGHTMMMERLTAMHAQQMQANDPTVLLSIFQAGLATAKGLENNDDDNPWNKLIGIIPETAREVKGMMGLKALHAKGLKAGANQRRLPSQGQKSTPTPTPQSNPTPALEGLPPVDKLVAFQELADRKGLSIEEVIDTLRPQIEQLPDAPFEDDEDADSTSEGPSSAPAS